MSVPGLADAIADPADLFTETMRLATLLKDRTLHLDPAWNAFCGMHARYGMLHQALVEGGSAYVHRPPRISHYLGTAKPWHDFDVDDLAQDFAAVRQRAIKALEAAGSGAGGRMRRAGALPQSRFGATHTAQPQRCRFAPRPTDRRHPSSRGASCTHS